jgi:hypothetical protein
MWECLVSQAPASTTCNHLSTGPCLGYGSGCIPGSNPHVPQYCNLAAAEALNVEHTYHTAAASLATL